MRAFSVGLVVLLASCNAADAPGAGVSGTWQITQPSGWTDFRFTLTEAGCTRVLASDPCAFAITGNATSTPDLCSILGVRSLSKSGAGYPCSVIFPVTGRVVADDLALNFGAYSDGASMDLAGRVGADRTIIGDFTFSDASGVIHHVGGGCSGASLCLETPGQLQFIRGGTTLNLPRVVFR